MLQIPIRLKPSKIPNAGIGAFALMPIKKNTVVWRFQPFVDRLMSDAAVRKLPRALQDDVDYYGIFSRWLDKHIIYGDEFKYLNHSNTPNLHARPEFPAATSMHAVLASRDIRAGEELTYDYSAIESIPPKYKWAVKTLGLRDNPRWRKEFNQ